MRSIGIGLYRNGSILGFGGVEGDRGSSKHFGGIDRMRLVVMLAVLFFEGSVVLLFLFLGFVRIGYIIFEFVEVAILFFVLFLFRRSF